MKVIKLNLICSQCFSLFFLLSVFTSYEMASQQNSNTIADLLSFSTLPPLIPDTSLDSQILTPTPQPQFIITPAKSNNFSSFPYPSPTANPSPYHHPNPQHTNAPYLIYANTNLNITNIDKNISYNHSKRGKEETIESGYIIESEQRENVGIRNKQKSSTNISINLKNSKHQFSKEINSFSPLANLFQTPVTKPPPTFQPIINRQFLSSPPPSTPQSSRRLNHQQFTTYQSKLNELNNKISQILSINQHLQSKIEQTSEQLQSKSDENKRFSKRIVEINERIREQLDQHGEIDARGRQEKEEYERVLAELMRRSGQSMREIQERIAGEKRALDEMRRREDELAGSIEMKRRELEQVREFSARIQRGISDMRLQ